MPISILDVKSGSGTAISRQLAAFAVNPSAGDLILVGVAMFQFGSINLPTDTAGNTYVQIGPLQQAMTSNCYLAMFYAKNIVGGALFKVSISFNTSHAYAAVAWAVTGADLNPYNGDFVARAATGTAVGAGPSIVAPPANSLFFGITSVNIFSAVTEAATWNVTGANGFTAAMKTAAAVPDYSSNDDIFSEYKISSSVENAQWTIGSPADWAAIQASFKPLGSGSAGVFPGVPPMVHGAREAMERYTVWTPITLSNSVNIPGGLTHGIWVGTGGDIAAVNQNNVVQVIPAVPSGAWLPISAKRINVTGTTASNLLALYQI